MNNDSRRSSSTITKLLIAAIVVTAVGLVWLLYARVVEPHLAANVALTEQVCFTDAAELCFKYPSSWTIAEEQADLYQRLALANPRDEPLLSIAVGEMTVPKMCDRREKRALHVLSSQPVESMNGVDGQPVHVVRVALETPADGFLVPLIYLTTDKDQLVTGQLQTCALAGSNIIALDGDQQLISGIDDHSDYIGSTAPSFRSLSAAKQWLTTPDATVAYRVLSSMSYQSQ